MNTRKILTMSLCVVLCGCQPEAPANAAPPVEQAAAPARGKISEPPPADKSTTDKAPADKAPADKTTQAVDNIVIAAAEQTRVAPPSAAVQEKPAQPSSSVPQGGESGTMLKSDDIKAEPFRDAKTVAKLATGDKVDIIKKDGGWYQVTSAKGKGWVRMLSIRKGVAAKSGSSGLLALTSGRAGTGKVVATTGIRGLNEEELKAAKFDEEELKQVESYATSKSAAAKFAATGKLAARPFDYLPAPK